MSRHQSIENALISINETVFQELCDSFLAIRNKNYSAFSRIGTKSGKQKTISGTPDSLFLLPSGKYLFVEHSTNITKGVSKLKEDIKKCLDFSKTNIPVNQIAEIILCINFNLKPKEIQELKSLLNNTRIALTLISLDSLAIELGLNHRDLVHQYLHLPIDTGQIVSMDEFVKEYNKASNGIATPLNNIFLHREVELQNIKDAILKTDFIILTGSPGVGKTKIALEAIKEFLANNLEYNAYCISYKNYDLLNDLHQYFKSDQDYILFVDDANRIDAFSQIIGFYRSIRKGKLKVVITVRDYALMEIDLLCQDFTPKRIDISKFSDLQIIDIIKSDSFKILNPDYQTEIVRIADGNPRLAIMAALLAKEKQNLQALADVSDLFEKYFSTFVKDKGAFADPLNIKCLGIIAFFYVIPYKEKELISGILDDFNISYSDFIDTIEKLDKLELVEAQYEHVKVPEQNLATYFFYKTFIKDNLLSFEILLKKYFESNKDRFRDSVIPANNTFGYANVMGKLKPVLQAYWVTIQTDETKAFNFLDTFWFYLQSEILAFIYNKISILPTLNIDEYDTNYDNKRLYFDKDKSIALLSEFFKFPLDLKEVLEVSFEYVRKKPAALSELLHKIKDDILFNKHDEIYYGFNRQIILFDLLINGLNQKDQLMVTSFYDLTKVFLSYNYRNTRGGRGQSIILSEYQIPNAKPIQQFRKNIWEALKNNFKSFPEKSLEILVEYSSICLHTNEEIMKFDIPFVLNIIEEELSPEVFSHCEYVQIQIRRFKEKNISHPNFPRILKLFRNSLYETFLKIDWNRYRDKEMYDFDDHREYEKLKEEEIRSSFVFSSKQEIISFYETFKYLKKSSKNDWNYNTSLEFVIDENFVKNFEIGRQILEIIVDNDNEINYVPRRVFNNQLTHKEKAKDIWGIIQSKPFKNKIDWELSFYDFLNPSLITSKYAKSIIKTIEQIQEPTVIHFDRIERYLSFDSNLFQKILKIIVDKNEADIRLQIWMDSLNNHFEELSKDIKLIEKLYLLQNKMQSSFDYDCKGLFNILKKDPDFLIDYVSSLFPDNNYKMYRDTKTLSFVWELEHVEPYIEKVFDLLIIKDPYLGILDHYCNTFFRNLNGTNKDKADKFLSAYVTKNNLDRDKINIVVDIVRHSRRELFETILLLYISLNQDVETFKKIHWRGSGVSGVGDVILADIEAADWKNILSTVEKSRVGIKLIPIKNYLKERIDYCLKEADWERKRRFIEKH
ncbi:MAG TPA: ATP-binding protein [Verrucomicrobiae bacterium]|nr:ATP-binding protein [Verrucomicrobiae bacterium]